MDLGEKLIRKSTLTEKEFAELLGQYQDEGLRKRLAEEALRIRRLYYGNDVYIRGLIEFTNICKNNCLYCGIRNGNPHVSRYRLTGEEILSCCEKGWGSPLASRCM